MGWWGVSEEKGHLCCKIVPDVSEEGEIDDGQLESRIHSEILSAVRHGHSHLSRVCGVQCDATHQWIWDRVCLHKRGSSPQVPRVWQASRWLIFCNVRSRVPPGIPSRFARDLEQFDAGAVMCGIVPKGLHPIWDLAV